MPELVWCEDAETGVQRWVTEEYLERWPDDYKRLGKPHLRDPAPPAPIEEQTGGNPNPESGFTIR